jgi:FSR family fosmidomycin resistance protein-like MFS transporter
LAGSSAQAESTALRVLFALCLSHMVNDIIQALLPAIYPMLKSSYQLSFTQVGLITLTFQASSSLLQPMVGLYTDKHPSPYSLAAGMGCTLVGLAMLSQASSYNWILVASALVGIGSAVFHPEASRMARLASGGRHGFAQSIFQVGGNFGTSLGPLLAAAVIVPRGQGSILWFCLLALAGIALLSRIGAWYSRRLEERRAAGAVHAPKSALQLPRGRVVAAFAVLIGLVFSKYVYLSSLTSYYTFYLIHRFGVSIQQSQVFLFVLLFSVAAGTIIGGPVGDRFGRKIVIWFSILGVAPFSLLMPHLDLFWTVVITVPIGVILASAFSAIIVYAQELLPGKVGLVAGLFFGMAFGIAGVSSALLGRLADATSVEHVYRLCAYMPLLGVITVFLPDMDRRRAGG